MRVFRHILHQRAEILDLDTETWSFGPDLPSHFTTWNTMTAVKFQDTILVMGSPEVYEYSIETNQFLERPEKRQLPAGYAALDVTDLF